MKYRINFFFLTLSLVLLSLLGLFLTGCKESTFQKKVGIIVPIEHKAMDQITTGFIETLHKQYRVPVKIKIDNAQGDINLDLTVILKVGDDLSTDEIMPAGARVLPYRSNIPKISEFAFDIVDETYAKRAKTLSDQGKKHAIIGGKNYGQGSSREHAALAPKYLGLELVIAKSFARIHWQNLINFGILPLTFENENDYQKIDQGDTIVIKNVITALGNNKEVTAQIENKKLTIKLNHRLSKRQIEVLKDGGLINWAQAFTKNIKKPE